MQKMDCFPVSPCRFLPTCKEKNGREAGAFLGGPWRKTACGEAIYVECPASRR